MENPDEAKRVLRQSKSEPAKLYLALLLHLERPSTVERDAKIRVLLENYHYLDKSLPRKETLQRIVESIRDSVFSQRRSLRFPCNLLKKHAALYPILGKMIAGRSSRVGHDCSDDDFPKLESVRKFWSLVDPVTWHARQNCREGSITRDYAAGLKDAKYLVYMAPSLIRGRIHRLEDHRLRAWAVFSRWNWEQYVPMEKQFEIARRDLAAHYREKLGVPEAETSELAGRALLARIFGVRKPTPWKSLHADILSGVSLESIRAKVKSASKSGTFGGAEYSQFAGSQEPAMMLAVTRPDILSLLLQRGGSPNITNEFGKTPLMAAAQYNDLQSLNALIAAGAKVTATSSHPSKIHNNDIFKRESRRCNAYNIKFGERMALMYAAANASRSVIEALLKAGADPTVADSEGNTADDYLAGRGPTSINSKISYDERIEVTEKFVKTTSSEKQEDARRKALDFRLLIAATNGTAAQINTLIEKGANLNAEDRSGRNAVYPAIENGKTDSLKYLISKGADLSTKYSKKWRRLLPVIELALYSPKNFETLPILIEAATSKTLDSNEIGSILNYIAKASDYHSLEILLRANLSIQDKPEFLRGVMKRGSGLFGSQNDLRRGCPI